MMADWILQILMVCLKRPAAGMRGFLWYWALERPSPPSPTELCPPQPVESAISEKTISVNACGPDSCYGSVMNL